MGYLLKDTQDWGNGYNSTVTLEISSCSLSVIPNLNNADRNTENKRGEARGSFVCLYMKGKFVLDRISENI